jgi:uncharacterized iron-regulated membrane protein
MRYLRAVHRCATLIVVAFTIYLSVTGTLIQLIDLRSIFTHAPATDPNVQAMREAFNGPPNFEVMTLADYSAQLIPAGTNYPALLARTMQSARAAAPTAAFRYVEFRMMENRPVGQVSTPGEFLRFDALTGTLLYRGSPPHANVGYPASQRNVVKSLHRMTTFGDYALIINVVVGTGLATLIVTGFILYLRMLQTRTHAGLFNPFWTTGGWWRSLHRSVALLAAGFLTVVMLSGTWLAIESLYRGFYAARITQHGAIPFPQVWGGAIDVSTPLRDAELPGMLHTTLAVAPGQAIKAVRLRYYSGMPQGVVIAGLGDDTRQLVFNTATGSWASLTEPGYPPTGFPFGWQAHQIAKNIHRGSFFGLTGRLMDLFAGLCMFYLSISGIVMYSDLWNRRRKSGRTGPFWV